MPKEIENPLQKFIDLYHLSKQLGLQVPTTCHKRLEESGYLELQKKLPPQKVLDQLIKEYKRIYSNAYTFLFSPKDLPFVVKASIQPVYHYPTQYINIEKVTLKKNINKNIKSFLEENKRRYPNDSDFYMYYEMIGKKIDKHQIMKDINKECKNFTKKCHKLEAKFPDFNVAQHVIDKVKGE
jgi:hypothetical protein